jgi:hypothetical protein
MAPRRKTQKSNTTATPRRRASIAAAAGRFQFARLDDRLARVETACTTQIQRMAEMQAELDQLRAQLTSKGT